MKSTLLPNNILKAMSPADRLPLGKAGKTNAEIQAGIVAKNEKELQRHIANLLNLRGIIYFQSRFGKPTTIRKSAPDFLFVFRKQPMAWEVKFGNNKLSDEQYEMAVKMGANGWQCKTIYTIEQAKDILDHVF